MRRSSQRIALPTEKLAPRITGCSGGARLITKHARALRPFLRQLLLAYISKRQLQTMFAGMRRFKREQKVAEDRQFTKHNVSSAAYGAREMNMHSESNNGNNEKLSEYLAGELAAWQSYTEAAARVQDDVVRDELEQCGCSHRQRAQKLRTIINDATGSEPEEEGAVWNSFASVLANGIFNDKEAIQVLEEEEELGLKKYREDQQNHEDSLLQELLSDLVPEQVETHDAVSILRISLQGS